MLGKHNYVVVKLFNIETTNQIKNVGYLFDWTNSINMCRIDLWITSIGIFKKKLFIGIGGVVGKCTIHYYYFLHPIVESMKIE
jgi:hypothetical protein